MDTRGYYTHKVEMRRHTHKTYSQTGRSQRPILRRYAISPNNVPQKTEKGVRPREGLRAPCYRVIVNIEADLGSWRHLPRACFACTYSRLALIAGGIASFDHFRAIVVHTGRMLKQYTR